MANTYSTSIPAFDIDTAGTTIANLTTLKGSAPSSADQIFIFDGGDLAAESSFDCYKIYLGDNSSGTAATKTGYCINWTAGITCTMFTTSNLYGMEGEGTTSYWDIDGSSGSLITIKSNTDLAVSDYYIRGLPNKYNYVKFEQTRGVFNSNTSREITNCWLKNVHYSYGVSFYAPVAIIENLTVEGVGTGGASMTVFENANEATISLVDYISYLRNVRLIGSASGNRFSISLRQGANVDSYFSADWSKETLENKIRISRIDQITQTILGLLLK